MKLVVILGSGAVGKMTVGQELMKITGLRLFHNHMAIEPVLEIFGYYDGQTISEIREAVFKNFASSSNYGMIFTYMWAFDHQEDWDYIAHVEELFRPYGTDFYYVELIAPLEVRLLRNSTENRIINKPSKRNIDKSNERIMAEDQYRLISKEGEIPFDNYLRIDNSNLSAAETALLIKEKFNL